MTNLPAVVAASVATAALLTATTSLAAEPSTPSGSAGHCIGGPQDMCPDRTDVPPSPSSDEDWRWRLHAPGRGYLGVGGMFVGPLGVGAQVLGGFYLARRFALEIDAYSATGTATGDTLFRVESGGISLRGFLLDTLNLRVGFRLRSVGQQIYIGRTYDQSTDVAPEIAIGNRWEFPSWFLSCEWITVGAPFALTTNPTRAREGAIPVIIGPTVVIGLAGLCSTVLATTERLSRSM